MVVRRDDGEETNDRAFGMQLYIAFGSLKIFS